MSSSTPTITFNPTTSKYSVTFAGTTIKTTITARAATASAWIREIIVIHGWSPAAVGLDVEWPHNRYTTNKAATLQLCINDRCLILQLLYMDEIPQSLKSFLLNPNFTFVGVEVEDDLEKLREEYGLACGQSKELRAEAMARWPGRFQRPGLKTLARELCGLHMMRPEHVSRSDWQARVLTQAQVEYACIDAFASYKIGHKLLLKELTSYDKFKFVDKIVMIILAIIVLIVSISILIIISADSEDSDPGTVGPSSDSDPGTVGASDDEAEAPLLK